MEEYDVIVVGGGITGAGIARDCALRGLKTILFEKNQFSSGATSNSTGLIHGGPRYILYDVPTTKISCIDSGHIYKIAPHLLARKVFLIPIFKNDPQSIEKVETVFEIYDRYQPLKGGKPHQRLSKKEALQLEPGLSEEILGAVTFDEWGVDPFKLTMANIRSARQAGAIALANVEVRGFLQENHRVAGVETKDMGKIYGEIICNATGPWGSKMAELAEAEVNLRPAKGIHVVFEPCLSPLGIFTQAVDGRFIFMVPRGKDTLIGTTDDDYYGDLDDIPVTQDEISYLLEAVRRAFPKVKEGRPVGTTAGLRSTLYQWGKTEDELSRDYMIFDHEKNEGIKGLITVVGGKMAIYRLMAEETTNLICQKLGNNQPCKTHLQALPEVLDLEYDPTRKFQEEDKEKIRQFFSEREDVVREKKAEVSKKRKWLATLNLALFYVLHYLRKLSFRKKGLKQFKQNYGL